MTANGLQGEKPASLQCKRKVMVGVRVGLSGDVRYLGAIDVLARSPKLVPVAVSPYTPRGQLS